MFWVDMSSESDVLRLAEGIHFSVLTNRYRGVGRQAEVLLIWMYRVVGALWVTTVLQESESLSTTQSYSMEICSIKIPLV